MPARCAPQHSPHTNDCKYATGGRSRGGLARSGADVSRASHVAMQMWQGASPVRPRMGSKNWDVEYARRQSCFGDVPCRSQWPFLPRQTRAPSQRTCAPNAATLRWHAVAVSPRWQPTRPDADAAQAEPSPGADLKSDPVWHGLAAQAPAHRPCARREGRPRRATRRIHRCNWPGDWPVDGTHRPVVVSGGISRRL